MLWYYWLELHHLNPNSILHIVVFMMLCEAFHRVDPHQGTWKYFFCVVHPHRKMLRRWECLHLGVLEASLGVRGRGNSLLIGWHGDWFCVLCENVLEFLDCLFTGSHPQF